MQYSLTLNLLANKEFELGLEQVVLLTYLQQKTAVTAYQKRAIIYDNKLFFWFNSESIAQDLPILVADICGADIEKEKRNKAIRIRRIMGWLEDKEMIISHPQNQKFGKTYFCFTERADLYLTHKDARSEEQPYTSTCNDLTHERATPLTSQHATSIIKEEVSNNNYNTNTEEPQKIENPVFEVEIETEKSEMPINENPKTKAAKGLVGQKLRTKKNPGQLLRDAHNSFQFEVLWSVHLSANEKHASEFQKIDISKVYDSMLNWSNNKESKKIDWISTAVNWIRRDDPTKYEYKKPTSAIENVSRHFQNNTDTDDLPF